MIGPLLRQEQGIYFCFIGNCVPYETKMLRSGTENRIEFEEEK